MCIKAGTRGNAVPANYPLALFEQGRRDVRISTALRVAAALKCTLNDLFN